MSSTNRHLDRRVGRDVFGHDVDAYRSARPEYPPELFSVLQARCGLGPGAVVFEIGPGTGLATERMLDLGVASLYAIEPDPRLAEHLMQREAREGRLVVVNQTFEECDLPAATFDMGIAASSFHWLDAATALVKVMRLLKPGGAWAMCWNVFHDMTGTDPFSNAVRHLFADVDIPPSFTGGSHYAVEPADRLRDLTDAGFVDARFELFRRELVMSPAQLRALYSTFSMIRLLRADERERRLNEMARVAEVDFKGEVRRTVLTPVYTARKP